MNKITIKYLQSIKPFINITKLIEDTGINPANLANRLHRGTPELTPAESQAIDKQVNELTKLLKSKTTIEA